MASVGDKSPDGDETQDSPSNAMNLHSGGYTGMPMHMYPFPPGLVPPQTVLRRSKRRQVKNACTNCQRACKKCDDARPCLRCVKYGIAEECVDSQRKERKKGIKRGPYKKRDGKGNDVEQIDTPVQPQAIPIPNGMPVASGSPPMGPFMGPVMYPPNFYSQYPPSAGPKPSESAFYPPFYITPVPPPPPSQIHGGQEGENQGYPPPPHFYPTPFLASYPQPYQTYMLHRADGQPSLPGPHYAAYAPMYPKPPSTGSSSELVGGVRDPRMDSEDRSEKTG